ncbi:hypothetical protein AX660_17655 [Paraglaciecola hydrolytica]|uniref:Lipoprotein n=2 Tax=Paraglaciecola hydrolytica TaxID=1799789 RepID=A0A135ZZ18_9ALTE|nr:hypothetical protein AX660_17655 [Paraglaciecola hydrolytica]
MKNLIQVMVLLSAVVLLGACASAPAYKQATSKGGNGYTDIKVADDRYRVQYQSNSKDVLDVTNMALYRAAEITQQRGYDWFVVTSRETFVDRNSVEPNFAMGVGRHDTYQRECGLLTCQTTHRPTHSVGLEISNSRERSEVQSILEIRLGKGMRPDDNSYSAADILTNLAEVKED